MNSPALGAPSCTPARGPYLVSLWEVDDKATASLMTGFYEAYAGGIDKAAALASAMARVRAQQAWQHTHYWGAFTLMGHWS
jgi:CHAT domain-containing protein